MRIPEDGRHGLDFRRRHRPVRLMSATALRPTQLNK